MILSWFLLNHLLLNSAENIDSQLRREKIHNVTFLLAKLLDNYEKSIRPNMNIHKPTVVYIDIYVRSMGPISELDGSYALDCYFRQRWTDDRLTFSSAQNLTLSLGMSMLDKIWKPDTYFWNGKHSYLHKLTLPNRLVRLSGDGAVLYSSRLTVKARCPMQLQKFPLDMQTCKLVIGSFGYRSHEVKYIWTKGLSESVKIDRENKMSQFEVMGVRMFNGTDQVREDATIPIHQAEYSALEVHFLLKRHLGYFLINFYIPCTLIVLLSWVAFWINRESTADRVTLGVTSVLTMTFLSLDSRSDLPRVEYPTALDIYILICYAFLVLCILEFAVVHTHTKYNTGDPELRMLEKQRLRDLLKHLPKDALSKHSKSGMIHWRKSSNLFRYYNSFGYDIKALRARISNYRSPETEEFPNNVAETPLRTTYLAPQVPVENSGCAARRKKSLLVRMIRKWSETGRKSNPNDIEINSTSRIDRAARALFPIGFVTVSIIYWHTYLHD